MVKLTKNPIPRELLCSLLESPHESIILVDRDGIVRYISRFAAEFYQVDDQDIVGSHILKLNPQSRLPEVIKTGKAEAGSVLRMKGKERIIARIPLRDKQGNIVGAFAKLVFWHMDRVKGAGAPDRGAGGAAQLLREGAAKPSTPAATTYKLVVGESPPIQDAKRVATQAAQSDLSLLITGETGTGKDLFAHSVHRMSTRHDKPFVKVNCGAIPQELFESELFGYQAGAFTGASQKGKPGKFELADGGTIFLDEIGEMPLVMQVKLLRVIQEQEVERLGATKPLKLSFRVIAATNRDLKAMMNTGTFRQDLYYRLNIFHLHTPPLRKIRQDIPRVAYHILSGLRTGKRVLPAKISPEAMQRLVSYDWPGNVRELKNAIERAAAVAGGETLQEEHLSPDFLEHFTTAPQDNGAPPSLKLAKANAEKIAIKQALKYAGGNRTLAAELLGIHRTGVHQKIKKYGLE